MQLLRNFSLPADTCQDFNTTFFAPVPLALLVLFRVLPHLRLYFTSTLRDRAASSCSFQTLQYPHLESFIKHPKYVWNYLFNQKVWSIFFDCKITQYILSHHFLPPVNYKWVVYTSYLTVKKLFVKFLACICFPTENCVFCFWLVFGCTGMDQ